MVTKRSIINAFIIVCILLAAAGVTFAFRADLQAWVFNQTGEESLGGQARGLGQLPLNIAQPRLDTEPYTVIAHSGVNPYGINTFLHNEVEPAKRQQQVQLIADAGFKWIREEFPWEDIEIHGREDFVDRRNDPAGVDAWAKYDQIVALAEEHDLQIIARLSNPPNWSRAAPEEEIGSFAPPDDFDDFANYAATVASRYAGRITYFQVWNEPNIYPEWGEQTVNPEAYTDLLCRAYDAIKAANPEAVVISGALAPTNELSGRDFNDFLFLQRMYDAGAANCFDVLAMQGYGLWSGPTDHRMNPTVVNYGRNQFIRDIMVKNGDAHKAIWISEMNWNVAPEDVEPRYGRATLEQQARFAPLAYQRAQEEWPWIGVVNLWYFKRADSVWLDERRPEAYFQVATPDFELQPIYYAMQEYTSQPPVMYAGNHAADHWAVAYGEGWTADEYGMASGEEASPVTFRFYGTSLRVILAPGGDQYDTITYTVDNGPTLSIERRRINATLWSGPPGEHTITIQPQGQMTIARYLVRDDPRFTPWVLAVLTVLLSTALFFLRRRKQNEDNQIEVEQ